jgi:acyl-CoA synthetase (AMP-forming)/AMP-acid ligase II
MNGADSEAVTLAVLARRRAETGPDVEAIADDGGALAFGALLEQAEALAASLHELGLRRGDVLSFQLPNWRETAILNVAASLAGLVCNPIVPIYRDAELGTILHDSGARCLVVPGTWRSYDFARAAARLRHALPALQHIVTVRATTPGMLAFEDLIAAGRGRAIQTDDADTDAVKLLLFTSGTTGRAKGVQHSHRSLTAPLLRAMRRWGIGEGDGLIMPSPVTHVTGYCCGLELPFTLGTRTLLMERWDAHRALALIGDRSIAATVGATPFLQELVAAAEATGRAPAGLRVFACGGASVPPALIRRASAVLGCSAFRVYGLTEAPLVTFGVDSEDPQDVAAETDGRINDYDVRIEGGTEGEILIRGSGLFMGYKDQAADAEAFTPDGYFRTGDIGRRVRGDALVITGRKKDLIIRGGENISAREIEEVLLADPRITDAAAVAMPHERLGETVGLFLVATPGSMVTLSDVRALLDDAGLAAQKRPEALFHVDALPRTASGKVRKDVLRERIGMK